MFIVEMEANDDYCNIQLVTDMPKPSRLGACLFTTVTWILTFDPASKRSGDPNCVWCPHVVKVLSRLHAARPSFTVTQPDLRPL